MNDESDDGTGQYGECVVEKGILCFVVRWFEWLSESNGVDDHGCWAHVYDFHDGVVEGVEGCKKVQVACDEYDEEEFMRFDGDTMSIFHNTKSE